MSRNNGKTDGRHEACSAEEGIALGFHGFGVFAGFFVSGTRCFSKDNFQKNENRTL
jgi:hypothetical protein